ncbi:hypothetical protein [Rathayibacter tanaceti]|uniref:WxL domain-containing protein n=2 Tax=Rathayibacter tanaceti TaxID=1671680 RepID=A0A162FWH8_9MICO|nr:hypothetical protein [Rathayibacter tanaceti]KZX20590.1 hypothetical protein ACH61_02291 [Rathayibacter tanaceti]QHC56689.1 hypothetical protein GSU10_14350 [Rathayibacter tanaceti]TCO36157.1 hypothetical protein EV639_10822 [Rathayibacter tanaceti]
MNTRSLLIRGAAGLAGGVLLLGVAGTAVAAEDPTSYGSDDVDVNVDIAELPGTGALSMTVAGTSTVLTESGSDNVRRQFTGKLPTVTVTDTRDAADIPDDAGWYVLGTASPFTSPDSTSVIGPENLGWTPALVEGGESGLVAAGDQVDTAIDGGVNGVGLQGEELLALAIDSQDINAEGTWSADADLFLRTPVNVDAGAYSSTVTLSLFE